MPDVVSIELMLDAETEADVRVDWARLEGAGMSSLGAHRSPSNRPHVTLLVRPELTEIDLTAAVALLPIRLELAKPVVFAHGDRGVLAWKVVPTPGLTLLHTTVHACAPPGEDAAHTAPGEWTPHITLARRLRLNDLAGALRLLGPGRVGSGVSLRRWDSAASEVITIGSSDP